MTPRERKQVEELQRPRRRLGEVLREIVSCPVCNYGAAFEGGVKIVRWRDRGARFECEECGLRFSIEIARLVEMLRSGRAAIGLKIVNALNIHLYARMSETHRAAPGEAGFPLTKQAEQDGMEAAARDLADWIEHVYSVAPMSGTRPPEHRQAE